MDSELGDVDWLRMDGSCAHGDIYGVLLTSALTMVVDMDGLFILMGEGLEEQPYISLRIRWLLKDSYIFLETSSVSEEFRLHFSVR